MTNPITILLNHIYYNILQYIKYIFYLEFIKD